MDGGLSDAYNTMSDKAEGKILWIGGTSSLTRTFVGCDLINPSRLVLVGLESSPPTWMPVSCHYVSCDLTTVTDNHARTLLQQYANDITSIIVGVRPLLFAPYTSASNNNTNSLLHGVQKLLRVLARPSTSKLQLVLHISSVAAMDHLRTQSFVSESEPYPPIDEYQAPYDKFKRLCEEIISEIFDNHSETAVCHLRLSGIFSHGTSCFQYRALQLQSRVGCFLPQPIDFNSSLNVSHAIKALLEHATRDATKIRPVYYYTRPLSLKQPVPYGYYVQEYRKAYQLDNSIWVPVWVVSCLVAMIHLLACWNRRYLQLPYVDALDYLLQVSSREHSFDCSKLAQDLPYLAKTEESMWECFARRKESEDRQQTRIYNQRKLED
jgi:hypothetical protein